MMVRRGARQGRSKREENEKKVLQQPFFFTQNPFVPLEPLNSDQLESIHRASMIILEQTGIEVNSLRARQFYKNAGAEVDEASQIVKLPQDLVIELIHLQRLENTIMELTLQLHKERRFMLRGMGL